jgi:hypothetical protein
MEKPTIEEVLELVSFWRDENGKLQICDILGDVKGYVFGNVRYVSGNVRYVVGNVGNVIGKILNK